MPRTTTRSRTRRLLLGVLTTLLVLGFAVPAAASAAQLTGKVTAQSGSSLGLDGTTVHVARASDGVGVGTDGTAGLDGGYAVTVPDGTYDVTFTPPMASGYAAFTARSVVVNGDTTLQVIVVPDGAVRFSGVLRDSAGHPLPNQYVSIGDVWQYTTGTGTFDLQTAPGPQQVYLARNSNTPYTPTNWTLQGTINLTSDHTDGFVLPTVTTAITTVGPSGDPIPGSKITVGPNNASVSATIEGLTNAFITNSGSTTTAGPDGTANVITLGDIPTNYDNTATPPAGATTLATTHFTTQGMGSDHRLTVTFTAGVTFSGVLRDNEGHPLPNQYVSIGDVWQYTTGTGTFDLQTAPGPQQVYLARNSNTPYTPTNWTLQGTINLTSDHTDGFVLPTVTTAITTVGPSGDPIPGSKITVGPNNASVSATIQGLTNAFITNSGSTTTAGPDGTANVITLGDIPTNYDNTATPPAGATTLATTHFTTQGMGSDHRLTVTFTAGVTFSGVLRDNEGHPLPNQYVSIGDVWQYTTGTGTFDLQTAPGSQQVYLARNSNTPYTPTNWALQGTINLTSDHTDGFVLPTVTTAITTVGPSGDPIPGSKITVGPNNASVSATIEGLTNAFITNSGSTTTAGPDGTANVITLGDIPTNYDNTATPPTQTLLPVTHFRVDAGTRNLLVVFERSALDAAPPAVTCDSADGAWHSDEVTLTCHASDGGTGLADPADATFTVSTHVGDGHEDADAHTGTHRVCDLADNCVTAGDVGGNKVDRQAPRITITQGSGSATVVADDAGLGDVTCTVDGTPVTVTGTTTNGHFEGTIPLPPGSHDVRCSADDGAGHSPTSPATPVDGGGSSPGIPSADAFTSSPDGDNGWWKTAPATATVHVVDVSPTGLACTVDGQPVALTPVTDATGFHAVVSVSQDGIHPVACIATDALGHTSGATTDLKLDTVAPSVQIASPSLNGTYTAGQALTADYTCSDATSSIASCVGDVADGATVDTSTTGARTFHVAARDRAGNSASAANGYTVQAATTPPHSSYADTVLSDHPLSYWRLGDGADTGAMVDETGAHTGEYKNGAGGSLQQGISGDGNTVAIFAGNGTYGYVNGIAAPQHEYTMEAWVAATDTGDAMIMQQGGAGALFISGGHYAFRQVDTTIRSSAVPQTGDHFDHVVGTWDGTTARLYVNGHLEASAPSTKAPSGSGTFYVGYGDLAPWFRGYLDEFAYYPSALPAARVQAHYDADPPPPLWIPRTLKAAPAPGPDSTPATPVGPAPEPPAAATADQDQAAAPAPSSASTPANTPPPATHHTSPPTPAATPAPLSLARTTLRATATGSVTVKVRNTSTTRIRGTVTIASGGRAIGTAKVDLRAGRSASATVRLTKQGRTLLKRHRTLKVTVTVTPAAGPAGRTATTLRAR